MINEKGYYKLTKNIEVQQPYHWVLVAPNHEIILVSENYVNKQMALKGILSVRVNCSDDKNYIRLVAKDRSPYFTLVAKNGETIGVSEMYSSVEARESGIEAVKKYGKDAILLDKTGEESNNSTTKPKPINAPQKPWISC